MRWFVCLLLVCSLPALTLAQCPPMQNVMEPMTKEVIIVSTTPKSLSPTLFQQGGRNAAMAVVNIEGAPVRYSVIGDPTPGVGGGVSLGDGSSFPICGLPSIQAFRMIRQLNADSTVIVFYYRIRQP